ELSAAREGEPQVQLESQPESQPEPQPEVRCCLTVITRRAAFDVASPRAAGLWGAVRALGHELGPWLDLRLVDVGEPADLRMLGWLARHDVRERELAISGGRLHAPRLVRQPGVRATFPASAGHPYQLCVTSP